METLVWSLDDGYGDNKMYNGKYPILIPAQCTRWRPQMQNDFKSDAEPLNHLGVEIDGMKYLVGKGALEQDTSLYWGGGDNKHKDQMFPIILKTCLGLMADSPHVIVGTLVMGLPVKADEDVSRHHLLQSIVIGTHNLKITFGDGAVVEREIQINELLTKKQPFGSFCDVILDKTGDIVERDIAGQFNVIVDIGSRTLNIYTLDSLDPIYDLSTTTNQGLYSAYEMVGTYIEENLGFSVPTGKLPYIIHRGVIKGVDLSDCIKWSYEMLANDIVRVIDTMFVDSWAYVDRIIFTGGGAELLKSYLAKSFKQQTLFLNRYSTVRGFWKYGVRHVRKKAV